MKDGYTVSDVIMAWSDTPVLGMQDAKLPQFTILSHETSNRRVRLATGVYQVIINDVVISNYK